MLRHDMLLELSLSTSLRWIGARCRRCTVPVVVIMMAIADVRLIRLAQLVARSVVDSSLLAKICLGVSTRKVLT